MSYQILKHQISLPAQNNNVWVFPIRGAEGEIIERRVDAYDLNALFYEAVGRHPRADRGDQSKLQDLLENWDKIEPKLRQKLASDGS